MSNSYGHPIKAVSRQTGLSPHLIRMWERRYQAVTPARTSTNRRLYSADEIERLLLLGRLVAAGHSISMVARIETAILKQMLIDQQFRGRGSLRRSSGKSTSFEPTQVVDDAVKAIESLDATSLDNALSQAASNHSHQVVIEQVIIPLLYKIGDLWSDGTIGVANEHVASVMIRNFLTHIVEAYEPPSVAPVAVITTPTGQLHEFGAIIATITAASAGWQVIYLGPNLPMEEIALAARKRSARLVGLSVVYPHEDSGLGYELLQLKRLLPENTDLMVGGAGAPFLEERIVSSGGIVCGDLFRFRRYLELSLERTRSDEAS
ncbi:MAG: MerR family transcriptional regulator [bacterium]|nr:MerR family transcriptional regulator [bacterium]